MGRFVPHDSFGPLFDGTPPGRHTPIGLILGQSHQPHLSHDELLPHAAAFGISTYSFLEPFF